MNTDNTMNPTIHIKSPRHISYYNKLYTIHYYYNYYLSVIKNEKIIIHMPTIPLKFNKGINIKIC